MAADHSPSLTGDASGLEAAVGAVLDDLKTFRARYWAPVLLGLIMLFDSWDSIAIAYTMPSMSAEWRLNPVIMGLLISAGYCGQFFGAIIFGAVAEKRGRMPTFVVTMTLMSLIALGTAWTPNYQTLLALRFFEGLMIGGALPISVTYINELAPTMTRGRYFAIFQWLCMSGYAASSVSAAYVIPHWGWRWLFGLGAIPILLIPLAAATLPESPRWLARKGRLHDANKALAKLGGAPAQPSAAAPASAEASATAPQLTLAVLFGPVFGARTIVVLLLWFLNAFANFGLTTWVPSIYVTAFHMPVATALRYAAAASLGFLVITPIVGFLMDRVGRRPIAILGNFLGAATMLLLAVWRPPGDLLLVTIVVTGQLGTSATAFLLWPFTAESYPTNIRAVAMGLASAVARASSMLTPLVTGVILGTGAPIAIVFTTYGVCSLCVFLLWILRTRETARVTLDSI